MNILTSASLLCNDSLEEYDVVLVWDSVDSMVIDVLKNDVSIFKSFTDLELQEIDRDNYNEFVYAEYEQLQSYQAELFNRMHGD